jgi:tRNA(fMet)-specific endonuclease VapC
MTYLLDTNVCIRYLNGQSQAIMHRLQQESPAEVAVCSVVKAELFYGARRSQNPERTLAQQLLFLEPMYSFPFDDGAAKQYGRIRAELASQGRPIGPNDLMIAAIALANELILVTHNVNEFSRVPDLLIEDWEHGSP